MTWLSEPVPIYHCEKEQEAYAAELFARFVEHTHCWRRPVKAHLRFNGPDLEVQLENGGSMVHPEGLEVRALGADMKRHNVRFTVERYGMRIAIDGQGYQVRRLTPGSLSR